MVGVLEGKKKSMMRAEGTRPRILRNRLGLDDVCSKVHFKVKVGIVLKYTP